MIEIIKFGIPGVKKSNSISFFSHNRKNFIADKTQANFFGYNSKLDTLRLPKIIKPI